MQANYGETEIQSLLGKVRIFDSGLGEYQLFAVNNSLHYLVKLSNGSLYITPEDFQADADRRLTPEILTTIARRFRESGKEPAWEDPVVKPSSVPASITEKRPFRTWVTLAVIILFLIIGGIAIAELLNSREDVNYYHQPSDTFGGIISEEQV